MNSNINKNFQIDHVSIGLDLADIAIIEEELPVLDDILQFALRETVHAESGSWNNIFMGYSNGYVEIGNNDPVDHIHFSIAFRSIAKGSLDSFRAALKKQGVSYNSGVERIIKGNVSLDWFSYIEFTDSAEPVPFFFIEYTEEYLTDIGKLEETANQIGQKEIATAPSGISSIDISLERSVFDLFSEIYYGKQAPTDIVEGKQVLRFGEYSALIIRRSTSSRLLEIRLPSVGQMGNTIRTNDGWTIGADGDELIIQKDGGRE